MKKKIAIVLLISCLAFIFYMSSKNGDNSSALSSGLLMTIKNILGIKNTNFVSDFSYLIRKSAHFIEFMTLGILAALVFKKYSSKSYLFCVIFCCLYAISDEIHQYFVPGRACAINDMILDSFGCLFGILIVFICLKNEKRNKCR